MCFVAGAGVASFPVYLYSGLSVPRLSDAPSGLE